MSRLQVEVLLEVQAAQVVPVRLKKRLQLLAAVLLPQAPAKRLHHQLQLALSHPQIVRQRPPVLPVRPALRLQPQAVRHRIKISLLQLLRRQTTRAQNSLL